MIFVLIEYVHNVYHYGHHVQQIHYQHLVVSELVYVDLVFVNQLINIFKVVQIHLIVLMNLSVFLVYVKIL